MLLKYLQFLLTLDVLVLFVGKVDSFQFQPTTKQHLLFTSHWKEFKLDRHSKIDPNRFHTLRTNIVDKCSTGVACFGHSDDFINPDKGSDSTNAKGFSNIKYRKDAVLPFLTSLFMSGALLGPWLDGYHGKFGVLSYANPKALDLFGTNVLTTDWWVPLLFGVAGVLIGGLYFIFDDLFYTDEKCRCPTGPSVCVTIAVFTFQYYLSGLLVGAFSAFLLRYGGTATSANVDVPIGLFLNSLNALLSLLAITGWYQLDKTKSGFLVSSLTAIGGPLIEVFIINYLHLYRYNPIPVSVPVQPIAMQRQQHQEQQQKQAAQAAWTRAGTRAGAGADSLARSRSRSSASASARASRSGGLIDTGTEDSAKASVLSYFDSTGGSTGRSRVSSSSSSRLIALGPSPSPSPSLSLGTDARAWSKFTHGGSGEFFIGSVSGTDPGQSQGLEREQGYRAVDMNIQGGTYYGTAPSVTVGEDGLAVVGRQAGPTAFSCSSPLSTLLSDSSISSSSGVDFSLSVAEGGDGDGAVPGYWFGIPPWIIPVYFLGGPAVGNLGRLYANIFSLRGGKDTHDSCDNDSSGSV